MILDFRGRVRGSELRSQLGELRAGTHVDDNVSAGGHRLQRQQGRAYLVNRLLVDAHGDIDTSWVDLCRGVGW